MGVEIERFKYSHAPLPRCKRREGGGGSSTRLGRNFNIASFVAFCFLLIFPTAFFLFSRFWLGSFSSFAISLHIYEGDAKVDVDNETETRSSSASAAAVQ